jgi:hypothetical protein
MFIVSWSCTDLTPRVRHAATGQVRHCQLRESLRGNIDTGPTLFFAVRSPKIDYAYNMARPVQRTCSAEAERDVVTSLSVQGRR